MADPNIFQQFLNKVGRGYGQIDKNIFGGLLPGGAATPTYFYEKPPQKLYVLITEDLNN